MITTITLTRAVCNYFRIGFKGVEHKFIEMEPHSSRFQSSTNSTVVEYAVNVVQFVQTFIYCFERKCTSEPLYVSKLTSVARIQN